MGKTTVWHCITPEEYKKKFLSKGLGSQLESVATGQTWVNVMISRKIWNASIIFTLKKEKNKTKIKTSAITARESHQGTHCFEKIGKILSVYPFLHKPQGKQVIDIKLVFM